MVKGKFHDDGRCPPRAADFHFQRRTHVRILGSDNRHGDPLTQRGAERTTGHFAHGAPDDGAILLHEIRSCLYPLRERPLTHDFIVGLGGREISIADCIRMYEITADALKSDASEEPVTWIGVRE